MNELLLRLWRHLMTISPNSYRIVYPNKQDLALCQAKSENAENRRPLGHDCDTTSLGNQFRNQRQDATQLRRSHQRGA